MRESEDPEEPVDEATAIVSLQVDTFGDAEVSARRLRPVLVQYGLRLGPVIGQVFAVTGPESSILGLIDHATVMDWDDPPPQAQPALLDLLRDTVVSIVLDTGAETFDDLTEGEFHDHDHDPPAS